MKAIREMIGHRQLGPTHLICSFQSSCFGLKGAQQISKTSAMQNLDCGEKLHEKIHTSIHIIYVGSQSSIVI